MFRSASARESDLAAHRFAGHLDYWTRTASTWFDGTIASVDERIAQLDRINRFARDTTARIGSTTAGIQCGAILPDLEQTRRELAAARDSLLIGFADRQDAPRPAGRRTASRLAAPEETLDYGENLGYGQNRVDPVGTPVHDWFEASLRRAITLGSRDFVADQNTDDREEILFRARRYAAEETSTLPIVMARRISAAFVGQVEELIARRPRKRQAAAPVTHYEDFDDQLIY